MWNQIKDLLKNEKGKCVIIDDGKPAFVLVPIDEYLLLKEKREKNAEIQNGAFQIKETSVKNEALPEEVILAKAKENNIEDIIDKSLEPKIVVNDDRGGLRRITMEDLPF